jgi:hypothetical protein
MFQFIERIGCLSMRHLRTYFWTSGLKNCALPDPLTSNARQVTRLKNGKKILWETIKLGKYFPETGERALHLEFHAPAVAGATAKVGGSCGG